MRPLSRSGRFLFGIGAAHLLTGCHPASAPLPAPALPVAPTETRHPMATWTWKNAAQERPHPGVTHWFAASRPDGTELDLFRFDFSANPNLRLEIFDQDEDDERPFDNRVRYWERGVGRITRQLNASRPGVVAAWNGLFFGLDGQGRQATASHLTPVVLRGKVYFPNVGNHRWTFGVQYRAGRPTFKTLHLPKPDLLAQEFDFASGAAQCLIREGVPLRLQPYPRPGDPPLPRPVRSTPQEAGHVPIVDHMKTSRTSLGWSQDSRYLYLLSVRATHTETESGLAFKGRRAAISDGWTVADVQRFWQALGVWGAIHSDGGRPAQLTSRRLDGNYLLIPPRWADSGTRRVVPASFPKAPEGGALLYFYVRDTSVSRSKKR